MIKLDVNNGVCTINMWICPDATGPVFSWHRQWVARPLFDKLHGVEEGEDGVSYGDGDGIDGAEELAPPTGV